MNVKNILVLSFIFFLAGCSGGGGGNQTAPVLEGIANQTTNQSTAKALTLVGTDANSGDTLTYSATSSNADVAISVSGAVLTLTPTATWNGSATISAKVNDGALDSDAQTFTLTTLNPLESFELVDPNATAGNEFGYTTTILANGNIVVVSPLDDSGAANAGAVHLYNPYTKTRIASFYGNNINDQLGRSVTALGNNNFVIASDLDDVGGVVNAGSVMLVNGATGEKIGTTLAGDVKDDYLGGSSVTALGNNNYVIASRYDDVGGVVNAGSVMLVNGATGEKIGTALAGDKAEDQLGFSGVTALVNNNYVIASALDDGAVVNGGSVMLVSGTTGEKIGTTLAGDVKDDNLGSMGVTALGNNNFVIASDLDDGAVVDGGSVMLVSGTTGEKIGTTLAGDVEDDYLGFSGVTALGNNNYVIASRRDDEGGVVNAGSVMLVDGATGAKIKTLAGDKAEDKLGFSSVTALANNNFVIASEYDDGAVVNGGSVKLVDAATGNLIKTLVGDDEDDRFGSNSVTALGNNNFVIASYADDVGGVTDAGSVMLVNGATGEKIGTALAGDTAGDFLGSMGVTALGNNHFVIASRLDDVGTDPVSDEGSIRQIDTTGKEVYLKVGTAEDDMANSFVRTTAVANFYIISLPRFNKGSLSDSGSVSVVTF